MGETRYSCSAVRKKETTCTCIIILSELVTNVYPGTLGTTVYVCVGEGVFRDYPTRGDSADSFKENLNRFLEKYLYFDRGREGGKEGVSRRVS